MIKSNILKTSVGIVALAAVIFGFVVFNPANESNAKNLSTQNVTKAVDETSSTIEHIDAEVSQSKSTLVANTGSFEAKRYISRNKSGFIGYFDDKPLDNPIDNIFHVQIDRKLNGNETVWLEYELYGVEDYTGIAHSVNDQLAVGGYIVKKSNEWKKQREQLNPSDLKKGDNVVRFTLPENADYGFQVKKLSIYVEPYTEMAINKRKPERRLVVNQPTSEYYYGNLGYLQGYVIGDNNNKAEILIDGERIRYNQGTFESLVKKNTENENWLVTVQAIFDDGQMLSVDVPFNKPAEWDEKNGFDKNIHYTEQLATVKNGFDIQLADAHLTGEAGSLEKNTNVSITALRARDIPALDAGMVNVTAGYAGYRFLPHGTEFKKDVAVNLGYDTTKIPNGYGEHDIQTYFFDEVSHHWIAIPRDSVLLASNITQSRTNHFSDYINAIIKVPESPETQGYTPTSMKDVKAANPATGINMIQPPSANSMGNANLSYPINIPAGRQGMQPQLAISYNSGGGNGWLGLGWDLSVPSISVETRWGVPRYNSSKESETYIMGGEQLSPVAHRSAILEDRTSNKQFYPRVEGSFSKIIRKGDSPKNYHWEVTDKNGIKYYYGAASDGNLLDSAILKDTDGNIAHWALVEVRDLNDNFVKYNYSVVEDAGVNGGTVMGSQIYLESVYYTGYENENGAYSVHFSRDRELPNFTKRKDITINARYGFKQVTADLLKNIEVKFNTETIRSYELNYKEGTFLKNLLTSITEKDASGEEFNTHSFDYYNDVYSGTTFNPYSSGVNWNAGEDNIKGGFIDKGVFNDKASVLSGSKSESAGGGLSVTVGPPGEIGTKSNTAGVNYSYTHTWSEGRVAFVDIDGDGLSDKVMMIKVDGENKMMYRPQLFNPDTESERFGDLKEVSGMNQFLKEKGNTHDVGIESNFGVTAGLNHSMSKSTTEIYFTDANGDGLIDIIKSGSVYFNSISDKGTPHFEKSSSKTPSPIIQSGIVDPNLVEVDSAEIKDLIEKNPLQDVVRMWQAPFNGTVNIKGGLNLIEDTSEERKAYTTADGVRVAIQHKGDELWSTEILPTDYSIKYPSGVSNIAVKKGDRIYFRVHSIFDGSYDQVLWNPIVEYAQHNDSIIDANNKPVFKYTAKDDYILASPQFASAPIDGEINIEGVFTKPVTSDDITIQIIKNNEEVVYTKELSWDTDTSFTISKEQSVSEGDEYRFKVISSTNIDWNKIEWISRLYYTKSNDPNITEVKDGDKYLIEVYAVPEFSYYPDPIKNSFAWHSDYEQEVSISPQVKFSKSIGGSLTFTVKKQDTLLTKQLLTIHDSTLIDSLTVPNLSPVKIKLAKGDKIFVEYHTSNRNLAYLLTKSNFIISSDSIETDTLIAGLHTLHSDDVYIFGSMYRNWGQFQYNGMDGRGYAAINEAELNLDQYNEEEEVSTIDLSQSGSEEEMNSQFDNNNGFRADKNPFNLMLPSANRMAWIGNDDFTFISYDTISSSRMGLDQITYENPIPDNPDGAIAVNKVTKSNTTSVAVGSGSFNIGGISISGSGSYGHSKVLTDYMDMNGDRYPDMLSENKIQYTTPTGGLIDKAIPHKWEFNHRTELLSGGVGVNGFPQSKKEAGNSPKSSAYSSVADFASLSAGKSWSTDDAEYSWMDINGDGLPDRLNQKNGYVALNLGYKFAEEEDWGSFDIRKGSANSTSGGLGVNIKNYSIAAGIGVAKSENILKSTLADINGDGLVDKVFIEDDIIKVNLNTGNGFSSTTLKLSSIPNINKGTSTNRSANAAFTIGIPILPPPFYVVKLCINPKVFYSQSFNRQEEQISDVDGDGFPDFVTSTTDDKLTLKKSNIKRTNLLKSVSRPLGAVIEMDYELTGHTYDMPQSVWALSKVEVYDGQEGDGIDNMVTKFTYENGYHDRHERTFYGFGGVKTSQLNEDGDVYRSTVRTYANKNYYEKGLMISEFIQDAKGKKYVETVNEYELKSMDMNALPDDFEESGINIAFPALIETQKYFYEGESEVQKSTKVSFGYGAYGNVVAYTDFGEPNNDSDDITASIDYWNVTKKNILSIPKSITVTGSGKTLRKRETSIDENNGKITQIRQSLEKGQAVYDMNYNKYGLLDSIVRPENYKGERMYFAYEYDDVVHKYVVAVRDAYGYNSSSTYEYKYGQLLSTTDINGKQTLYEIDNIGRITKITGPYEIESGQDYTIRFKYFHDAEIPWAQTQHFDPEHPENPIETAIFIDGLGRVLQTKKDGAIFKAKDTEDTEVMLVSGLVEYDAFGRSISSKYPVTENKGSIGKFNTDVDDIAATLVEYDVLGREVKIILPDGAETKTKYGFGNDRYGIKQFMTCVTDANGIKTESFTDVKGRQTGVKAPGDIWTSFVYNAINELTSVTDAEDNTTVSVYDMLGRRLSRNHPDAGLTEYTYDPAGNMLTQITANLREKGEEIKYEYDYNRLISITYPENTMNNVTFEYGKPDAKHNRAGRIVLQEDATGVQEFYYGSLGEITKNIRSVIVPDEGVFTFETEWEYDTWNRLKKMIYPDGEEVTYNYNLGGMLQEMYGNKKGTRYDYITRLGYDKFEDRKYIGFGNGTETYYDYENDRRRLKHILTSASTGRALMDNTYTYDDVNNITNLKSNASIPETGFKGGRFDYNFEYDDLYRLTGANGLFEGSESEHRYELTMKYSSTGCILNKDQLHQSRDRGASIWETRGKTTYEFDYKYEGEKPHAPSQIGENAYTYDANGNATEWRSTKSNQRRQILWDEENRIRAIAENGSTHHYIYDASGERVIKATGDGQAIYINGFPMGGSGTVGNYTMYVNPYMVVNNMNFTKHFYIEGQRIVSKLGEGGAYQYLLNDKNTQYVAGGDTINYDKKMLQQKEAIIANFEGFGLDGVVFTAGKSGKTPYGQIKKYYRQENGDGATHVKDTTKATANANEKFRYFYHPDHLGSSSYITDASGEVYQHFEYFPFGETFYEDRHDHHRTPYMFNGKELDKETGLYYYGARYYDPKISMFYGVDPLAERFPSMSSFSYAANNPIRLIDINGENPGEGDATDGTYVIIYAKGWDNPHTKGHNQQDNFKKNAEALKQNLIKNGVNEKSIVLQEASNEQEFLDIVNKQYESGKIVQLDVYGHMSNNAINFGGEASDEPINATPGQKDYRLLSYWSTTDNNYNPDGGNEILKINKGNFVKNAKVTLWGCNAGYFFNDVSKKKYALAQGFANHLDAVVKAFDSYSEFKTLNGSGKSSDLIFDGTMIRTKDRKTQKVVQGTFSK